MSSDLDQQIARWRKRDPLPPGIAVNRPDPQATWWVQNTVGVNYYRATLPARYLPGKTCAFRMDDVRSDRIPGRFGVVEDSISLPRQQGTAIWLFPGNNTRALVIHGLQEHGIPCFFECDDNYTVMPDVGKSDWLLKRELNDRYSFETASDIARFCDGVICSTPALADVYSELNDNVTVCRNMIDPTDWDELDKPDDGILRVGWAASASHYTDAPLLRSALTWLAGKNDVEIIMLGLKPDYPFRYTHIGWVESLADYRRLLQVLDIMLCPVRRTEWSDCKSDSKALEAAGGGAMAVVSESPSYDLWTDRTFVCKNEMDWLRIAKHLYRNREEVRALQKAHRDYVFTERRIQEGVEQWRKALSSVSPAAKSSRSATSTETPRVATESRATASSA